MLRVYAKPKVGWDPGPDGHIIVANGRAAALLGHNAKPFVARTLLAALEEVLDH